MSVNFGLLGAIPPGGVVGQLPVVQPQANNGVNSLAGGIMQGVLQGQQMQQNAQQMKATQQQMDFNSQNNPLVLEQNKQKVEGGRIEIKNAQDAQAYRIKVETAADKNEKAYLEALRPDDKVKYLQSKATYQSTVATAAKTNSETKKQEIINSYMIQDQIGAANSAALQYQEPQKQEESYQQIKKTLPPDVQKLMPANFDQTFAVMAVNQGTIAHAQYLTSQFGASKAADDSTPQMKNAAEIAKLKSAIDSGTATPEEQTKYKSLTEQTSKTPLVQTPGNQVKAETTSKYLQQRDTVKSVAVSNIASLDIMGKLSDKAMSGSTAETNLAVQKIISAVTGTAPNPKVPLTEALGAFAKTYQISQQVLMKGSSSERDMELLSQTGPQINNTSEGRKLMSNQLGYKEAMTINQVDFEHAWSDAHNADMTGAQDAWSKFVQTREDFNPKTNMFDKRPSAKDWKPFLDENYEAPKQQKTYQEGQVYQDSNGNKAKYMNGKWVGV